MYRPNYNNPQIKERTIIALGFTTGYFYNSDGKTMYSKFSEQWFGKRDNPIYKYLKSHLLTIVDDHYSAVDGKCMTYKANHDGIRYIRYSLNNPSDKISYNSYLNMISACLQEESSYIDEDGNENILTIEQMNVNLKCYNEPLFDGCYVKMMVDRRFKQQLLTGDFIYTHKSYRQWNPLQSIVKREVREDILSDFGYCHAYDIEACAPTLLYQFAKMQGFDKELPAYEFYLDNKKEVREQLAMDAKCDIHVIKEVINATFNGAKLGINDQFALYHALDECAERINAIRDNSYYQLLKKDIAKVWGHIKACNGCEVDKFSINWFDMNSRGNNTFNSRKKWNLYFQLEKIVMDSIRQFMVNNSLKFFNEHDGWTSQNQLDIDALQKWVYDNTGFMVNISYKHIIMENNEISIEEIDERLTDVNLFRQNGSVAIAPDHSSSLVAIAREGDNINNNIIGTTTTNHTHVVPRPLQTALHCGTDSVTLLKEIRKKELTRDRVRKYRLKHKAKQ